MKVKTILVSKESYLYLQDRCKYERSGKYIPKSFKEKLKRNFDNLQYKGYIRIMDKDFGGAKNGKWTSWSIEEMAEMLDKKHLDYKLGEDMECLNI